MQEEGRERGKYVEKIDNVHQPICYHAELVSNVKYIPRGCVCNTFEENSIGIGVDAAGIGHCATAVCVCVC